MEIGRVMHFPTIFCMSISAELKPGFQRVSTARRSRVFSIALAAAGVPSPRLDPVAHCTAPAAYLGRSAEALGHADRVHRAPDVLGVGPVKLKRDAVLTEQPAPTPHQELHDLVLRRHGRVLVGTALASLAAR